MRAVIRVSLLATVMLAAAAAIPAGAAAQCGWCDSSGSSATCKTSNEEGLRCGGVFLWFYCTSCDPLSSLPSDITPDGSLAASSGVYLSQPAVFFAQLQSAEETYEGAFVVRRDCNQAVTHRWYSPEAEDRLRKESSALGI